MRLDRIVAGVAAVVQFGCGCTIAAFGPAATRDGRPLLWKNRDVDNPDQELRFFDSDRYRFVANVYAGETDDVWAGINEKGFAIMNSDSYNIGGDGGDDGRVMRLALGSCATVEEFARLMDSLNLVGREIAANYGVFDSTGATAIFEASNTYYVRYDTGDETLGFLIRANYSMHGDTNRLLGKNRYDRAVQVVLPAFLGNRISPEFVIRTLARDMGEVDFDPYPLPFEGTCGELPYGYIPAAKTICRTMTRSVEVMVGPEPGGTAGTGMMWVLLGPPEVALPVPVWVNGGPVPEPLDGPLTAELCDEALALRDYTRPSAAHPNAVNTFSYSAMLEFFAPVESAVLDWTRERESRWGPAGPDQTEARELTARVCQTVLGTYEEFWRQFDIGRKTAAPDESVRIVPNPVSGAFSIPIPAGVRSVRLHDVQGRLVRELPAVPGQAELCLDPSGLAAGTYYVVFSAGSGCQSLRLTKPD